MSALVVGGLLALGLLVGGKKKGKPVPETTPAAAPPPGEGWQTYGSPVLTGDMRAFLDALSARLGRRLVVTSGARTATAQASAMLKKLAAGEDLHALYKADDLVDELLATERTVEAWAAVIESQVARGRVLSNHQTADAVDIDDKDAAGVPLDRAETLAAAEDLGAGEVLYEDIRSHYHFGHFFGHLPKENSYV